MEKMVICFCNKQELETFIYDSVLKAMNASDTKLVQEILDVKAVALQLRLSQKTIYKLVSQNKIPFKRPESRRLLFLKSEILEWISNPRASFEVADSKDLLQTYNKSKQRNTR